MPNTYIKSHLLTTLILLINQSKIISSINCYNCHAVCEGSIFNSCLTSKEPSCQQTIACCTGKNLKLSGVNSKNCGSSVDKCLSTWTFHNSDGNYMDDGNTGTDQILAVKRSCPQDQPLSQETTFSKRLGLIEDQSCSDICQDYCFCVGPNCNNHKSRSSCRRFTAVQGWLFAIVVILTSLIIANEIVWKKYFIEPWKNKLEGVMKGDARHGQGYDEGVVRRRVEEEGLRI